MNASTAGSLETEMRVGLRFPLSAEFTRVPCPAAHCKKYQAAPLCLECAFIARDQTYMLPPRLPEGPAGGRAYPTLPTTLDCLGSSNVLDIWSASRPMAT